MQNIYNLTTDIIALGDRLLESVDEETGEVNEEIANALSVKQEQFPQVAQQFGSLYRYLENLEDDYDKEIKRLKEEKDKVKARKESLKEQLDIAFQRLNIVKVDGVHCKISYRKSIETLVDETQDIPDEYMNIKITKTPNKTKIKQDLQQGVVLDFAQLVEKQNIQIK